MQTRENKDTYVNVKSDPSVSSCSLLLFSSEGFVVLTGSTYDLCLCWGLWNFVTRKTQTTAVACFPNWRKGHIYSGTYPKVVLGQISKNLITLSLSQHPKYSHVIWFVHFMAAVLWRDRWAQSFVSPKSRCLLQCVFFYNMFWFHQKECRQINVSSVEMCS